MVRGRPEIAGRHGAGRGPLYRPCGSWATWAYTVPDAPGPHVPRARCLRTSARPTSSKGVSTRSGRTSCGSPTFPRKREVPPPVYAPSRGGSVWLSSPTCAPGGSAAGRPPAGQCAPTWPWTPREWPSGSGNVRGLISLAWCTTCDRGARYRSRPLRAGPVRGRGGRLGGVEGGTPFGFALAEALSSLYKAELIRNQGPLGGHRRRPRSPPSSWCTGTGTTRPHSLRHRHANPRRARSRLGTRRQPEQPETTTTGNHRHQLNQPPQNPGLDRARAPRIIYGQGQDARAHSSRPSHRHLPPGTASKVTGTPGYGLSPLMPTRAWSRPSSRPCPEPPGSAVAPTTPPT